MTSEVRPPTKVELRWEADLRFRATAHGREVVLDGDGAAGLTPVEALAAALGGCMAVDVVHILKKGRLDLRGLAARVRATRADAEPRRFVAVELRFVVTGDVPTERVERAIALSREKYCSVWHSLRADIAFTTAYEVLPA